MAKRNASIIVKTTLLWLFLCLAAGAPIVIGAPDADVDLAITKSGSPDPVVAGTLLTYQLSVSNAGPSIATGVVFTDTLPSGVTYASATSGCVYNAISRTVRCTPGNLGIGSTTNATIQVQVDPATTGSLLNQAVVTTLDTDTNASNDTAQITTGVTRSSDLRLGMTAPATAIAGGLITYTFTITNSGPSDASGVSLEDDFSPGTSYISSSTPCTRQGLMLTCNVGNVAANSNLNITITFRIDPGRTAALVNDALVTATTPDPDMTNNDASLSKPVSVSSDISISKSGTPATVTPGDLLTYTLTTSNNGLSTGQGVQLTDTLPPQVLFQSYTATKGTCTGTSTITCTPGSVTPTEIITIRLIGQVAPTASAGVITNTVNVNSTSPDPTPGNNSASARTTITSDDPADLQISKRDLIDPVRAGETLTYTITVSNTGPASATGVIVNDTLPSGVTLRSAAASQGSCVLTSCQLGSLAVNGRATVTLAVNVDPAATGVITNTATVTANEEDPANGNNSANARTTVVRAANLSIVKTGTPQPVFAGRILAYRLVINNHGPSRAEGVHVVDPLPTAVSFVSAPAGCIHTTGTVDCNLGALSPSSSRTITITTQVAMAASGLVQNTASVSSSTTDPVPANNQSNWSSSILAPDHVLPTVTWTQPVSNTEIYEVKCQVVHLQVNATDNIAIQSVRFYRWDAVIEAYIDIGTDVTAPYGWDLDTCNLNPNWNEIFAEARDTYGNKDWSIPEERKSIFLYRKLIVYLPAANK